MGGAVSGRVFGGGALIAAAMLDFSGSAQSASELTPAVKPSLQAAARVALNAPRATVRTALRPMNLKRLSLSDFGDQ